MRPGDIGLVRIPGVVGRGIRAGQWMIGDGFEDYEHAVICTSVNTSGVPNIIQAMPGGAEKVRDWGVQGVLWVRPANALQFRDRVNLVSAALDCVGTPYSFLDYSAIALHRFHIPAPGLRDYIADTGHMICSQLVDYCYQQAGIQLFDDGRWNGYVTPGDLWQLFWERKLVLAT